MIDFVAQSTSIKQSSVYCNAATVRNRMNTVNFGSANKFFPVCISFFVTKTYFGRMPFVVIRKVIAIPLLSYFFICGHFVVRIEKRTFASAIRQYVCEGITTLSKLGRLGSTSPTQ